MAVAVVEKETIAIPEVGRRRLPPTTLMLEGQTRRRFGPMKCPPGTTKEDPMYAEWWVSVRRQLNRHDLVTLLADDESWEMECCVESVKESGVEISIRKVHARKAIIAATTPVAPGFHTEWRSGASWCVIREKDGFPVEKGHALEGSAIAAWRAKQPRPVV